MCWKQLIAFGERMENANAMCGRLEITDGTTHTARPPRVLVVDDDELVLEALRAAFHLETDYTVWLESDVRVALDNVSKTDVDVVISDFLMPHMDGVSFLEEVRRLQPTASLILLSGHADRARVRNAVGELGVQYVEKPWSNDALVNLVRLALRHSDQVPKNRPGHRNSTERGLRFVHSDHAPGSILQRRGDHRRRLHDLENVPA